MTLRMQNWRVAALVVALLSAAHPGRGVLMDWSLVSWTPGSLTNSYDMDPSNPGNDVTVAFSGDTSYLTTYYSTQSPFISVTNQGGLGVNDAALMFAMDYSTRLQAITVTITFNYAEGVNVDAFRLFDIDRGADSGSGYYWTDQIRKIWGTTTNGSIIAATLTNLGSAVTRVGTGTNQSLIGTTTVNNTGAGSGDGNATIVFQGQGISSFTFTYGSFTNSQSNPAQQHVQLYDLNYRKVPEVGVASVPLALLGAVSFLVYRRRSRASS